MKSAQNFSAVKKKDVIRFKKVCVVIFYFHVKNDIISLNISNLLELDNIYTNLDLSLKAASNDIIFGIFQ